MPPCAPSPRSGVRAPPPPPTLGRSASCTRPPSPDPVPRGRPRPGGLARGPRPGASPRGLAQGPRPGAPRRAPLSQAASPAEPTQQPQPTHLHPTMEQPAYAAYAAAYAPRSRSSSLRSSRAAAASSRRPFVWPSALDYVIVRRHAKRRSHRLNTEDSIEVMNDGKGIPIVLDPKHNIYIER